MGLDGLGKVRGRTGSLKRAGDEEPARARFNRDVDLAARKALCEALNCRRRRIDPPPRHLARLGVQCVERDLPSVDVKPSYDRHRASFELRL
jgi:hypothetical protein